ncbi:MAG: antibiotic biosynthesis monooxygenase family protein [Alphaproteobacteria bacterium]
MPTPQLTPPYAVEIVNYKLNDGADPDAYLALCRQVGAEFTSAQPGFLHREIGRGEDDIWAIIVTWKTADDARNSISNIDTIPDVVKEYMAMINRETLTRAMFDVV